MIGAFFVWFLFLLVVLPSLWAAKHIGIVKCRLCGSQWTMRRPDQEKVSVYSCLKCGNESW